MRRATIGLLLAATVVAGCGGSDDTSSETTVTTDDTSADTTVDTATVDEVDDTSTDITDDTEPTDSTIGDETDDQTDAPAEPVRPFPWLVDLPLLTEPSDDLRPLLAWAPVDDAVLYSVTVTAPTGEAYWAWQTDATSVHLGGDPRLDDDQSGPSTLPGMTWSVIAFDADDRPVAASVEAVLHP